MKLSIYLGEDEIRAVLGRFGKNVEIKGCLRLRLKKGALINDLIADEGQVREALTLAGEKFSSHKNRVRLMLGGNEIVTKVLAVPKMTRKQMMDVAVHELKPLLPDSEDCDYIYDYSVIRNENRGNRGRTILCAAMRRSSVECYRELFRSCGMKLEAIGIAVDRFSYLADVLPRFRKKTFILAAAEGRSLTVSMYLDGIYHYSNRLRLVEERGTRQSMEEMEESILSVVHFYRMQKADYGFEFVCLCGMSEEEESRIVALMMEKEGLLAFAPGEEGIAAGRSAETYLLKDYLYVTGDLAEDKECMNLLAPASKRLVLNPVKIAKTVVVFLIPVMLLVAFLLDYGTSSIQIYQMDRKIDATQKELEKGMDAYEKAREARQALSRSRSYEDGCMAVAE